MNKPTHVIKKAQFHHYVEYMLSSKTNMKFFSQINSKFGMSKNFFINRFRQQFEKAKIVKLLKLILCVGFPTCCFLI